MRRGCHGVLTALARPALKSPGSWPVAPFPGSGREAGGPGTLAGEARLPQPGWQPRLWTVMCTAWGSAGVSLWITVREAVNYSPNEAWCAD